MELTREQALALPSRKHVLASVPVSPSRQQTPDIRVTILQPTDPSAHSGPDLALGSAGSWLSLLAVQHKHRTPWTSYPTVSQTGSLTTSNLTPALKNLGPTIRLQDQLCLPIVCHYPHDLASPTIEQTIDPEPSGP